MKLIANIERKSDWKSKVLKCTFPKDNRPFMREAVLRRNLGPRPYSEISFTNNDGQQVVIYVK